MMKEDKQYNFWTFTLKVMGVLSCLVWLSSYMQLQFLADWQSSTVIKKVGYFWIIGLAIDLVTLVFFTVIGLLSKKYVSSLSLSVPFYLLAVLVSSKPTILPANHLTPLTQSFLKALELWILGFLHLMLSEVVPNWISRSLRKSDL